jgi:hypothetical protein
MDVVALISVLKNEITGSDAFLVGSDYAISNDKAIN